MLGGVLSDGLGALLINSQAVKCAPGLDLETGKRGSVPLAPLTLTDKTEPSRSRQRLVPDSNIRVRTGPIRRSHVDTHTHLHIRYAG